MEGLVQHTIFSISGRALQCIVQLRLVGAIRYNEGMIGPLIYASLTYLLLPLVLFGIGWMRPVFSVPFALAVVGSVVWCCVRMLSFKSSAKISARTLIILIILAGIWTILSGAGHRGFFDGDYYKHNAILSDLIAYSWPVQYRLVHGTGVVPLVYYIAYYLPAAVVGLIGGWKAANIALFVWTWGGVCITFLWIAVLVPKKTILAVTLFVLFSGLDGIGRLILLHRTGMNADWEWWAGLWQYSGITTQLFYVPQHSLPAWIVGGMLLFQYKQKQLVSGLVLACSAVLLWSPFVFIGLLPFFAYLFFKKKIAAHFLEYGVSIFVLCMVGLYLASSQVGNSGAGGQWLFTHVDIVHSLTLVRLALFYLFEFGIYLLFIKKNTVLWIATAVLIALPWYRMGLLNDFVMRASLPALFILAVSWAQAVPLLMPLKRVVAIAIIVVASIYPFLLYHNAIIHFSKGPPRFTLSTLDTAAVRMQYVGEKNSVFFRSIARPYSPIMGIMNLNK